MSVRWIDYGLFSQSFSVWILLLLLPPSTPSISSLPLRRLLCHVFLSLLLCSPSIISYSPLSAYSALPTIPCPLRPCFPVSPPCSHSSPLRRVAFVVSPPAVRIYVASYPPCTLSSSHFLPLSPSRDQRLLHPFLSCFPLIQTHEMM